MPHIAAKVTADANSKFTDFDNQDDPFWTPDRVEQVLAATTLVELGEVLGLTEQNREFLAGIEGELPRSLVKGILAGYQGAAENAEPVQVLWMHSSGFRVSVTTGPDPTERAVSIVVRTPETLGR